MAGHGDLITLGLKMAFQERGCPICRLRAQAEHRYMLSLLREHVNDGATRQHIIPALGFCPTHAWYLQRLEATHWQDGLGMGIIYEDLLKRTRAGLDAYIEERRSRQAQEPRWRQRLRIFWHRLFGGAHSTSFPVGMAPSAPCRVCTIGAENETTHLIWLVKHIKDQEFSRLYARSDGLCLPHLRRALHLAEETAPEAAVLLAEDARKRTDILLAHLQEYIRKHGWQHRHETKRAQEEESWIRAVAFYAGENPPSR